MQKNPQDHENDLYFQLGLADHGETGFKFNFEHTYDDVDANSHDLPDGSKSLYAVSILLITVFSF